MNTDHAMVKSYHWSELEQMTASFYERSGRNPDLIGPRDIKKFAKHRNLMNGYDFAEVVDRSSAIRVFFLVAMEIIPLDMALPKRGALKSPSEILSEFAARELPLRIKYDYISDWKPKFSVAASIEGYYALKEWFRGGLREVNTSFGSLYLPRDCYIDSLNAMRVPIWEPNNPQEPFVKGSLQDPHRKVDDDLFIGSVVSLHRTG
jgi:hypothetical protein